jgi:hypothetical protein
MSVHFIRSHELHDFRSFGVISYHPQSTYLAVVARRAPDPQRSLGVAVTGTCISLVGIYAHPDRGHKIQVGQPM